MNGMLAEGEKLTRQLCLALAHNQGVDVCLCPPFTLLHSVKNWIGEAAVTVGAQNAHFAAKGAFTGEISLPMLKELGCSYVLLGHSERRQHLGEANALIAQKLTAAQAQGIIPVLCVGESLEVRDSGAGEAYVLNQLRECLVDSKAAPLVVAYEPIWAIGTGRAASALQAEQMLSAVRRELVVMFGAAGAAVRLLYGGSVTAANIGQYLASEHVNGALVGGASLKAEEFAAIVRQAEERHHV